MLKHALIVAGGALAVAVLATAPTPPAAAASCKAGYEPVKIQGNWVCRLKTPKLPLKAKTQGKKAVSGADMRNDFVNQHNLSKQRGKRLRAK